MAVLPNNYPGCETEGHCIAWVPGEKLVLEQCSDPPHLVVDASGDGYIGCVVCEKPVWRIQISPRDTIVGG